MGIVYFHAREVPVHAGFFDALRRHSQWPGAWTPSYVRSGSGVTWPRVRARHGHAAQRRAHRDAKRRDGDERHRASSPYGSRPGEIEVVVTLEGYEPLKGVEHLVAGEGLARRVQPVAAAGLQEALRLDGARRGAPRRRALPAARRGAAPGAGHARQSLPRHRPSARRGRANHAPAHLRHPRRQPRHQRLLPRRHARAAAVPLRRRRRRHPSAAGRPARLLPGRLRRQLRPLRRRHHRLRDAARPQRRARARRARAQALRHLGAGRDQAAGRRHRRGRRPLRLSRRTSSTCSTTTPTSRTGTTSCAPTGRR